MNSLIKLFSALLITCATAMTSCSSLPVKIAPQYKNVDPKIQKYVDEYVWLSIQNHIYFHNKVTAGFTDIKESNVVGLCTYGVFFREIDIDSKYWSDSTGTTKISLLFHELTHCYCGRTHDYGNGVRYPETETKRIAEAVLWKIRGGVRPGYWGDGCPISLMHPVVVSNECMRHHYGEYTKEMFDRCDPY